MTSFSTTIISFIDSGCNFNLDFLCLVCSFASCDVGSGVGSGFGILPRFLLEIICFSSY